MWKFTFHDVMYRYKVVPPLVEIYAPGDITWKVPLHELPVDEWDDEFELPNGWYSVTPRCIAEFVHLKLGIKSEDELFEELKQDSVAYKAWQKSIENRIVNDPKILEQLRSAKEREKEGYANYSDDEEEFSRMVDEMYPKTYVLVSQKGIDKVNLYAGNDKEKAFQIYESIIEHAWIQVWEGDTIYSELFQMK